MSEEKVSFPEADGALEPPERIKIVIRASTTDDWIGVAYCKDYKGDPSTIHEYARVRPVTVDEAARRIAEKWFAEEWAAITKADTGLPGETTAPWASDLERREDALAAIITAELNADKNTDQGEPKPKTSRLPSVVIPESVSLDADQAIDFSCRVCGVECDLAPDPPARAVCPEHCDDHDYRYERELRGHYCFHCGQEAPQDWGDD